MAETVFFILAAAAIVLAVLLSVFGLRSERFPATRGTVAGIGVAFAALVVATAAFAWMQASEHQEEHAAEQAEERQAAREERAAALREAIAGELATGEAGGQEGGQEGGQVSGEQVFASAGCASCHTLEAAGATGTVGPNLDQTLQNRSPEEIERQIVDPNSQIASGFQPGVMPENFEQQLGDQELQALVDFLAQNAG